MTERKPETGSAWFVMLPAVWAGRMGGQNEMARMNRKARLCPGMFRVRQFDPRKGIGRQDFIEVFYIPPNALARPLPRPTWRSGLVDRGYHTVATFGRRSPWPAG